MRKVLLHVSLLVVLAWSAGASAQSPGSVEIQNTITRQLNAMKQGDDVTAFSIASPAIQNFFQGKSNFMKMVRLQFPQVYRSRNHRFLNLVQIDGKLIQRVLVESNAGTVVARYEMVEIGGNWRINGCILEQRQDV